MRQEGDVKVEVFKNKSNLYIYVTMYVSPHQNRQQQCRIILVNRFKLRDPGERIAAHRAPNPAIEPADDYMTGGKY